MAGLWAWRDSAPCVTRPRAHHIACALYLAVAIGALGIAAPVPACADDKHASMVIDANSGAVLHAKQADEPRYPASLTKMMTLYLVFEEMELGRIDETTRIMISATAAAAPPSRLGIEPGGDIAAGDAVKALVTKSANDIAIALAEHIAGSEAAFAKRMTERARQMGMSATTFRNASGLPDPAQVTTARDMLTLALRLSDDFPQRFGLFRLTSFTYAGKTYRTHNTLMRGFPGMDGMKTGYTRASGFNLVSSVHRDGKHLVGAVFGGESAGSRNALMRTLLYRGLQKASTRRTREPAPVLVAATASAKRPAAPLPAQNPAPLALQSTAEFSPTISMASVRPVSVLGTASPGAGAPQGADGRPARIEAATGHFGLGALRDGPTGGEPAADATGQQQDRAAGFGASQSDAPGRAPSTLQQQAATLGAEPPAPPPAALGPANRGDTAAAGGYQIQVGAFASAEEAQRQLTSVLERAAALLAGYAPLAQPASSQGRQVWRARFAGFEAQTASSTCQELRRNAVDCFVTKAE